VHRSVSYIEGDNNGDAGLTGIDQESANMQDNHSSSIGRSSTRQKTLKERILTCDIPFVIQVAILMCIPVGFLCGISGTTLQEGLSDLTFLQDHKVFLKSVFDCSREIMWERSTASIVISTFGMPETRVLNNTRFLEEYQASVQRSRDTCDNMRMLSTQSSDASISAYHTAHFELNGPEWMCCDIKLRQTRLTRLTCAFTTPTSFDC
jgi:hypothetical protein